jgi:hypothetical protein
MAALTVGDTVYVQWDVGTVYGLAGEITPLAYTVHIQLLIEAGYGHYVPGTGDTMQPFGNQPIYNPLTLSKEADFDQDITPDGNVQIPEGTTARLAIVNPSTNATVTSWPGTVSAASIRFTAQSAETDVVPHGYKYRIYVTFPTTPTREVLWYYGPIQRKE